MEKEDVATEFTAAMDRRGLLAAQALAKNLDLEGRHRLLDVAGGSGIYACSLAAHFPELTGSVLEKPPVDRIAARSIAARGFSDRIGIVSADMFTAPLPDGYDIHLLSNVLHDWDVRRRSAIARRLGTCVAAGGLVIIHDAFLNADKTGPLTIASYSVLLMHVTQGRCYSVAEMEAWLDEAGFETPAWFQARSDEALSWPGAGRPWAVGFSRARMQRLHALLSLSQQFFLSQQLLGLRRHPVYGP